VEVTSENKSKSQLLVTAEQNKTATRLGEVNAVGTKEMILSFILRSHKKV
jgi:co-chaperonin GroES (HSP10)